MNRFVQALSAMAILCVSAVHAEEVVNVYSARHYDTDDALIKQFTKETGIKVNIIEGRSDTLLSRIKQEGELCPADVFITVDAGRLLRAEEMGVLQPVKSKTLEARVPASLRHPEGLWFGLTKRARIIVVSADRVPEGIKLTYEQLADPKWKGKVLIRSSGNIYNQSLVASLIDAHGAEKTEAWCKGIVANMARTPQGGDRDQIRGVAAGEGDVAVVNHYYLARMMGLAMTRVGGRRSPEWGGLEREDSDSEDARRGRELRCTYGLAAVREEHERMKAWFTRKLWAPLRQSRDSK